MSNEPVLEEIVTIDTNSEETWAMTGRYGVQSAVNMGAKVYAGNIVVLFVQGKRKGQTNAIRMQPDELDRFCNLWLEHRSKTKN